jgi:transcriptional regulator with XRE-family HTH domain
LVSQQPAMQLPLTFDAWDCKPPPLPARSRLYSLEPIGIGTPFVESLSGYVARLADAHAVSVGDLAGRELSAFASKPLRSFGPFMRRNRAYSHGFHAQQHTMNGFGITSRKWIEALERATRRTDLRWLTLLPFESVLSRTAALRRSRAWCPACYEGWRSAGEAIYEPLLWAIAPVTVCPRHRRPLAEACGHCHGRLMALAVYSRPGYCSRCQTWLGDNKAGRALEHPTRLPEENDVALWHARAIGELLANAPRLNGSSLRSAFMTNFRACVDAVAEGNQLAFARTCGVSPCALNYQMGGKSLPRIDTLLRICYRLNIRLTALLESDSIHLTADLARAKDAVRRHRQLPLSRTPEQVRRVLEQALRAQPPLSLSEIARRLDYKGTDRLYQVDRNLAKQIVANYRKSGRSHWWRKPGAARLCALADMQKLLEQSLAQERPISAHHIAANLGYANDGYLQQKFPDLCRAIRRKIAAHDEPRISIMESTLKGALREEQVPTLTDLCRRLGYSNSLVLRYHFPELCEEILARRRDLRNHRIVRLRKTSQAVLLEEPAPSFVTVCKRVGLSYATLGEMCPAECTAIRSRYRRRRSEASRHRKAQLLEDIRHVVESLQAEGKCPSVKRVTALLPDSVLKDWRSVSTAVNTARRELGPPRSNTAAPSVPTAQ